MGTVTMRGARTGFWMLLLVAAVGLLAPAAASAAPLTWSAPIALDQTSGQRIDAATCLSASECVATDELGRVTVFDPAAPGLPASVVIDPGRALPGLACPASNLCVAVALNGGTEVTFDPGASAGAVVTNIDGLGNLGGVSCPSVTQCTAVDGAGYELTFDPRSPGAVSKVRIDTVQGLGPISCPTANQCTTMDFNIGNEFTFDPNAPGTPTAHQVANGTAAALSCPSAASCTAILGHDEITFTIGNSVVVAGPVAVDTTGNMNALTCSTSQCVAVDDAGRALTFLQSQTQAATPVTVDLGRGLTALACPTAGECAALDSRGGEVTFLTPQPAGTAPSSPSAVDQVNRGTRLADLACLTVSLCVAASFFGSVTAFNPLSGAIITPTTPVDPHNGLSNIACPGLNLCVGVDASGGEVTFNPSAPGTPAVTVIDPGAFLTFLSCPAVTQCTTIDANTNGEITFNPAAPGTPTPVLIDNANFAGGLSCPTTTQCTLVDASGNEVTFNPQSPPSSPPTPTQIDTSLLAFISCPTANQCTTTDNNTREVTFNPASPGTPVPVTVDPTPGAFLTALSCPSRNECVSVDDLNGVFVGDPTSSAAWSVGRLAGASESNAVTCPAVTVCVSVDSVGNAFAGIAPPVAASPPLITGQATQGQTLTESHGTWSPPPTGFAYQWEDCDGAGAGCTAISGATGQSYVLQASDVGHTVRVVETASDSAGAGAGAPSSPTAVIQSLPVPAPVPGRVTIGRVKVSGTVASVPLTCTGASGASCVVTLKLTVTESRRRGKVVGVSSHKLTRRTVVLGAVTVTLTAGQRRTVRVALRPAGKRLLSAFHKLPVRLTVLEGKTTVARRALTFAVKSKKRR